MPIANPPKVGPILGHTDAHHARVFFRANVGDDTGALGRAFGIAQCRRHGQENWHATVVNKLSPNFDLTGVFVFAGLTAGTRYEYRVGWFPVEEDGAEEIEDFQALAAQVGWSAEVETHFFTTQDAQASPRSYVVGSCRYLLRLFGGNWFDDRGDKVFRSVLQQMEGHGGQPGRPVHALVMMGDQVYADDLNVVAPDSRIDQFLERYRVVFSQQHVRALMARVPTYMILDDHEIEDNWPTHATKSDRLTLYPAAIHAYQIYQCSHGPVFDVGADGRIQGVPRHFWYSFHDAASDWFVMDTRTEREPAAGRMVGPDQMKALIKWLEDASGRIKFIVSPVPMFPDLASDNDDKWGAFPGQRKEILDFIFDQKIPNVVVLSGDVHASFSCSLRDEHGFAVHGVVSSSFFWPYPHMARSSFLFGQPLAHMGMKTLLTLRRSECVGDDNFTRLDVALNPPALTLTVSVFGRKGEALDGPIQLF